MHRAGVDSYTCYKEIKYILKHDSHRQYLNGIRKVSLCSKMSKKLPTFKDYLIRSDFYVKKKNKRTVSNSRTGWEIYRKLINAQCLISKHRTDFFWKINKRTCAFIRQARVCTYNNRYENLSI